MGRNNLHENLVTLCLAGKEDEAVELYLDSRCKRDNCHSRGDPVECAACLKEYFLYCSLISKGTELEEAISRLNKWISDQSN